MLRGALLQERGNGRMDPEVRSLADELGRRGIPVEFFLDKRLHRGHVRLHRDVVVAGHIPVVLHALRQLGVEPPPPDDYPHAAVAETAHLGQHGRRGRTAVAGRLGSAVLRQADRNAQAIHRPGRRVVE